MNKYYGWAVVTGVCLLGMVGAVGTARAADSIRWDFDEDIAEQPLSSGWTVHAPVGTTVIVSSAQSVSPNHSVEMYKTNDFSAYCGFRRTGLSTYFPIASNTFVTYKVRLSHTDVQMRMYLLFSTSSSYHVGKIYFSDGNIEVNYDKPTTTMRIGTFEPNVWYTVNMSTVRETETFNVCIMKGELAIATATNLSYLNPGIPPSGLWFLYYGWFTRGKTGPNSAFVDDIYMGPMGPSSPPPSSVSFDFDTDVVGQPPLDWADIQLQRSVGSTVVVSSAQSATSDNSLELRTFGDWTTGQDVISRKDLGWYLPSSRNNLISFQARFPATDQQMRFNLVDQNGKTCASFKCPRGEVIAHSGNPITDTVVGTFVPDVWYEFQIMTVPSTYTYDLRLLTNGVVLGRVRDQDYYDEREPAGLMFISDGWLTKDKTDQNSVFIDQIQIGPAPIPPTSTLFILR